ncbi:hypothetical protein K432DRAFT_410239 [Lepidopterella palustris CBS 459.81]|uniref:Uncharacterized protein n=1 Tax=Lepidopterella palustris CBS 459.81 TaxID=1314670 RepID=A0A8E2DYI2_9PEZI|nr:hypothetical protein K432DRAFT_410239 [Lepidopterella palustris CBS 459.81]
MPEPPLLEEGSSAKTEGYKEQEIIKAKLRKGFAKKNTLKKGKEREEAAMLSEGKSTLVPTTSKTNPEINTIAKNAELIILDSDSAKSPDNKKVITVDVVSEANTIPVSPSILPNTGLTPGGSSVKRRHSVSKEKKNTKKAQTSLQDTRNAIGK